MLKEKFNTEVLLRSLGAQNTFFNPAIGGGRGVKKANGTCTHLGDNCLYSQYIQGITISKWQVSGFSKGQQYNEYCDAGMLIQVVNISSLSYALQITMVRAAKYF